MHQAPDLEDHGHAGTSEGPQTTGRSPEDAPHPATLLSRQSLPWRRQRWGHAGGKGGAYPSKSYCEKLQYFRRNGPNPAIHHRANVKSWSKLMWPQAQLHCSCLQAT